MALLDIRARLHPIARDLAERVRNLPPGESLAVHGAAGSTKSFFVHTLAKRDGITLWVLQDEEAVSHWESDLQQLDPDTDPNVLVLRTRGRRANAFFEQDEDVAHKVGVLQQIESGWRGPVLCSAATLALTLPQPEQLADDTTTLRVGEERPVAEVIERLEQAGFQRVEYVEEVGEYALRGGILDVFSYGHDYPIRVEFFGDEIDTLREFDIATQRSVSSRDEATLISHLMASEGDAAYASLLTILPTATRIVTDDAATLFKALDKAQKEAADAPEEDAVPLHRIVPVELLQRQLGQYKRLDFVAFAGSDADAFEVQAQGQPAFSSNVKQLRQQVAKNEASGIDTYILCDSAGQKRRLEELLDLEDPTAHPHTHLSVETLHEGFVIPELKLHVYTDHQIFNRYHRPTSGRKATRKGGITLRDLAALSPGDFIVHTDYGIGKFAGMKKIEVRGKQQEAVRLIFRDDDVLYTNVNALYKLHKYSGKEGHQPTLTKLGTGEWDRKRARAKKRVKDVARDLIKLYAARKAARGFAFGADSLWQRELESSFRFEDTPDQATAVAAVKEDMQQPTPMDRLVCGDVGFGKTEVAVRAAFKAAQEGKQVAVLVPTTILAAQHYDTFKERMEHFPIRVEQLSRFRTKEQQKATVKRVKEGKTDILIGTHRIVSKDVEFKDLGLLIVDEEQRFGVKVKERLRQMRANVDTLTLTATPIPRTLQFSLLGARDLSIINTPPPNRQPIQTEVHPYNPDLVRDAIRYEVNRGGQVFFVHNRVRSIDEIAAVLRALVPDVRMRVAHGQMKASELEDIMHGFMEKRFDVLVSTNIVESGLDVTNANTIIINSAQNFGLSELHQLRGRVGRSNAKAYCYLLVPSLHTLTKEARARLQAIEEFSDLGSGFNVAMRDLDIRGAGNMLGAEQSGFIEDIGFETYHKILDEAVQELRADEFADVFDHKAVPPAPDTVVDVEEDTYLPDDYVTDTIERLNLYRRISDAETETALDELRQELRDRFGPLPDPVKHLMDAVRVRLMIHALRLPRVQYKNQRLFLEFPAQSADPYFYDHLFRPLLARLDGLDNRYVLKQSKKGTLRAIVQDVPTLESACELAQQLADTPTPTPA